MLARLNTFYQLLKVDVYVRMKQLVGQIIDMSIWVTLCAVAFRYVYPELGMTTKFASLMATSGIASMSAFELFGGASDLNADFNGDRRISYQLGLPISSVEVFLKIALGRMIDLMSQTIVILPIFKLVLLGSLDLSCMSTLKFAVAFIAVNLFGGLYSVWASSLPSQGTLSTVRVWVRIIFPLWYFGGNVFPYYAVSSAFPRLSKLLLLNPFVYATESLRVATLGQSISPIPFWASIAAVLFTACVLGLWGVARLRKRLDFI